MIVERSRNYGKGIWLLLLPDAPALVCTALTDVFNHCQLMIARKMITDKIGFIGQQITHQSVSLVCIAFRGWIADEMCSIGTLGASRIKRESNAAAKEGKTQPDI